MSDNDEAKEYQWPAKPYEMTPREVDIVQDTLREFGQLVTWRNVFASQWEEIAELILPTSRNTFFYNNFNWPGVKKTEQQIDASGMMALHTFAKICDSLLTPRNMMWHQLEADNEYVMKDRATRLWFEDTNRRLFKYRYNPLANFSGQNQNNYQSLGAFGNMSMFVDAFDRSVYDYRGLRYKAIPLGEMFYVENHQGVVDGFCRWFRLTARQAFQKWGAEKLPENLRAPLEQDSQMPFDFIHRVCPRNDYDPDLLGARGKPFASYYVSIQGRCLLSEGGYRSFPVAVSRYDQTPGEVYGRGPGMMVLPSLKTLNAQKATLLRQGHKAVDPVLLSTDDGLVGFMNRPGAMNAGGMSQDGRPLVGALPVGNINIGHEMMDMESAIINDAFLVNLFKLILDEKVLTATQVMEIVNQKGILIAPTMGRQQSEYLGPMIDRELDVMAEQGLLLPMPPRLKEAKGEYHVVYTSPLSLMQRTQEAAGFTRTLETVKELVNITQDPSLLDPFDFDTAIPAIAAINATPESWMADGQKIANKRKARAKNQQAQQQIQAAPAQAAMMKAQAAQMKAGMMQPPQPGQPQPQGVQ